MHPHSVEQKRLEDRTGGGLAGRRVGVAAAVVSALAFSTEGLFSVGALRMGADVPAALALRYLVAVAYVAVVLLLAGPRRRDEGGGTGGDPVDGAGRAAARGAAGPRRQDLAVIFALGGLAHGAVPRLLFEAFMRIPTWLALLLFYLFPVLVHVGEHVLGRHPLGRRRALTVAVTLAGAALVANPSTGADIRAAGVLLAVAAAFCNAAFLLAVDPVLQRTHLHHAVAAQFGGGAVVHAALLLAGGSAAARLAGALPAWPWLVGLGLVTTGAAVTALSAALQRLGAARTSLIGMLEPVFAVAWGVALLGESVTPVQALGAAVVILGVAGSIRDD
nr:hypothetical protein [Bacillota bacterium]